MGSLSFLLDSNVLSELTKAEANAGLMRQLAQHRAACATTTVVMHELAYGVARLPESARKTRLRDFVSGLIDCGMTILPYDLDAALWHAGERARLEAAGLTPPFRDGQIAAVAASRNLTLVSRNLADFQHFQGLSSASWFSE
ncbi:MAG: type II toxin-antitoxin system VapC family toxin [Pseudomonadota bacterium]|nr:type II toxin-antitoxin system VapC family toxin [Pseudomonadota bacterium]MDP1904540.1 type II toxin-antitoxin system VapC family toxin [Pseudomonadota bacterium]MDP2353946.1 type II toxin-antitoxin system VapC family toxin [Pseudomonadota bacterium]